MAYHQLLFAPIPVILSRTENRDFCLRQNKIDVRPFCWTDLTLRDIGLSSVLYRALSV